MKVVISSFIHLSTPYGDCMRDGFCVQSVVQLCGCLAVLVQFVVHDSLVTLQWFLVRDSLQQSCYMCACASSQVNLTSGCLVSAFYLGGSWPATASAGIWIAPYCLVVVVAAMARALVVAVVLQVCTAVVAVLTSGIAVAIIIVLAMIFVLPLRW